MTAEARGQGRMWARYTEQKYKTVVKRRRASVSLEGLTATQGEIELIKYRLVMEEDFRIQDPIVVYRGRMGRQFVIDGHTRARVKWDKGERIIPAILLSSPEPEVDMELVGVATRAGGGETMEIKDVPIVDRIGEGTEEWEKRRRELLAKLQEGGEDE